MAATPTQCAVSQELSVVMTLAGHERYFADVIDGTRIELGSVSTISYSPDGQRIVSGSHDKTARVWDLQVGKEIEEARISCEQGESVESVSRDGRWVVVLERSNIPPGEIRVKAYDAEKGIAKKFSDDPIMWVDISVDNKLLAGGTARTTQIWSLDTGELVAGPFECADWLRGVRFSHDARKLAIKLIQNIQLWDITEAQNLVQVGKFSEDYYGSGLPVLWTTKDRSIVATFDNSAIIYEFDASTLETVGPPFKAHGGYVSSLALSFDSALLASASCVDDSIKLWAFESRQLLASFNVQRPRALAFSPNARQVAYATSEPKIYICDIPPNLWPSKEPSTDASKSMPTSDPFVPDATTRPAPVHRPSCTV